MVQGSHKYMNGNGMVMRPSGFRVETSARHALFEKKVVFLQSIREDPLV